VEFKEMKATVSLTNPLPIPLRKGVFNVEGPGIAKTLKLKLSEYVFVFEFLCFLISCFFSDLASQATGTCSFSFTPHFAGKKTLSAKFTSEELDDVDGFLEFMVKEANPATNGTSAPLATTESHNLI
jgi:transglutaminase 1